ncbi:MAG TPA: A/G-specific adenine glycosylase [Alphaproteobacteria bacterium]|nr:A/G-specific adenine glycosylase [Alphaproteobacteria bacterium]
MSLPATAVDPAPDALAARLLAWYDRNRRWLPWRAAPGERADPYRVWLSEIMLQQTTVPAVTPYFLRFLARWPSLEALASAPLEEVLTEWAGLGYYARARNLHRCARTIVENHAGRFPDSAAELAQLPGIGPYTAGAISAIAFNRAEAALDGNAERVLARLYNLRRPISHAKAELRAKAEVLIPTTRPGDFAQALMDLGAMVCTPLKPHCMVCPWQQNCAARRAGAPESVPVKSARAAKPLRHGVAFWAIGKDGAVLLRRRAERGLLGGMAEVPSTEWRAEAWTIEEALRLAPFDAEWRLLAGRVRHVFTHFRLELTVLAAQAPAGALPGAGYYWCPLDRLGEEPLPSLMRKVIEHGLAGRMAGAAE